MPDPIDSLAVGLAADHQAEKRKRAKKGDATDGVNQGQPPVEGDGAPELREAVASLGEAVAATDQGEPDDEVVDRPNVMADRIEAISVDAVLDKSTLVGDLVETILELFKTRDRLWFQTLESDQRTIVSAIQHASRELVSKAVVIIAGASDAGFRAKLEKYGEAGGLKISLSTEATEDNVLACHRAHNQYVMVRRIDPAEFSSTKRDPATLTDADEPPLEFEGGKAEAPAAPPPPVDPADADRDLLDAADGLDQVKDDADPFGDAQQ